MFASRSAPTFDAPSHALDPSHLDSLRPELVRLGTRILGSRDLAEDAVQEALIALWQQATGPDHDDLRGWLIHAVAHRALHLRRCHSRRTRHESSAARTERIDSADRSAIERETSEIILDHIATLPEFMRAIVERRVVCELDYAQIAAELDVPIGTVRSRLSRARQRLAQTLGPLLHDDDCPICRHLRCEDAA